MNRSPIPDSRSPHPEETPAQGTGRCRSPRHLPLDLTPSHPLETLIKSLEAHRYSIGVGKALNLSIEPSFYIFSFSKG